MRAAEVMLEGDMRSAYLARRFLAETLSSWDADTYLDAAALVLSELVANAALHARTEICIRMQLDNQRLRFEVADGSFRRPVPRHYSADATTGRGLGLISALTDRWGVEFAGSGKVVWAELAADGRRGARLGSAAEVDLSDFPDLDDVASRAVPEGGPSARRRIAPGCTAA